MGTPDLFRRRPGIWGADELSAVLYGPGAGENFPAFGMIAESDPADAVNLHIPGYHRPYADCRTGVGGDRRICRVSG